MALVCVINLGRRHPFGVGHMAWATTWKEMGEDSLMVSCSLFSLPNCAFTACMAFYSTCAFQTRTGRTRKKNTLLLQTLCWEKLTFACLVQERRTPNMYV